MELSERGLWVLVGLVLGVGVAVLAGLIHHHDPAGIVLQSFAWGLGCALLGEVLWRCERGPWRNTWAGSGRAREQARARQAAQARRPRVPSARDREVLSCKHCPATFQRQECGSGYNGSNVDFCRTCPRCGFYVEDW